MEFQKGLNVIIGSNNSGKTGLLYAIRLLNEPVCNLLKYTEQYLSDAPKLGWIYDCPQIIYIEVFLDLL